MSFNVPSPQKPLLAELDAAIEALQAAVLTVQASEWIKAVPGDSEGTVKFVRVMPPIQRVDVADTSAVALTTNVTAAVGSIVLPAGGVWRVQGQVGYAGVGSPTLNLVSQAVATSAALPGKLDRTAFRYGNTITSVDFSVPITPRTFDLRTASGNTTLYLVAQAVFTGGTSLSAYGWLEAEKIATA